MVLVCMFSHVFDLGNGFLTIHYLQLPMISITEKPNSLLMILSFYSWLTSMLLITLSTTEKMIYKRNP